MKCAQFVCYPGINECTSDDDTSKETTEGPGLRGEKPGKNNHGS